MKKLAIVLLIISVVGTAYAAGEVVGTANGNGNESEIVVELVDMAVQMFPAKGKDYTMKLINASAGPLRKGAVYVFAVDFNGRTLCHPVQPELRGQDHWNLKDAKGNLIVQDLVKIAKEQGQGWYEYWWLRVNETAPTLKKTFLRRVPGEDMFVASGYYVK